MNYFRALPLKIVGWRGLEAVGLEKMAGISVKESIAQRIERLTTKIASLEDEGGESLDQLLEELSDISVMLETSDSGQPDLHQAITFIGEEARKLEGSKLLTFLKTVVISLQTYAFSSAVALTTATIGVDEKDIGDKHACKSLTNIDELQDTNEYFMEDLLVEFIEQHEILLEEFESKIITQSRDDSLSSEELLVFVKNYLHTLKGDSGTIGLSGIEKTSHRFEDLLEKRSVSDLLEPLLLLKNWVLQSTKALIDGSKPFLTAKEFNQLITNFDREQSKSLLDEKSQVILSKLAADQDSSLETKKLKTFVKVDTNKLDRLIETISEMIVATEITLGHCRENLGSDHDAMRDCDQLSSASIELRDMATSLRLLPVSGLFNKISRVVWEAANRKGKEVRLETFGHETELDRAVFEQFLDPLMHMIRNSITHGIESSEERVAAGKPPVGSVRLGAEQVGESLQITVSDDGRGLDSELIREKAIARGLINENAELDSSEIFQLIFHSGFSTTEEVDSLSGRGVGMNVVKSNIEKVRGRVGVKSEAGQGTTFTLEIPLTLGIIEGVVVRVGVEELIVPLSLVVELIQAKGCQFSEGDGAKRTLSYRNQEVLVSSLGVLVGLTDSSFKDRNQIFIISKRGDEYIALGVDEIVGTCSAIIRPLDHVTSASRGIAGAAILSDGEVRLVVDLVTLSDFVRNSKELRFGDSLLEDSLPYS